MNLKKFSVLLLIGAFCGCEAAKPPEAAPGPVIKKNKETLKGNTAVPNEPM